jgi:hypothetical protein
MPKYRVINSWCVSPGVDTKVGDVIEVPENEAAHLIRIQRIAVLETEEAKARGKSAAENREPAAGRTN